MSLEMVAPRLIAPILGNSIYTWTSIIGFVLLGLSLGNFLGGRLADRGFKLDLLGKLYLTTAVLISAINIILNQKEFVSLISWSVIWDNLIMSALLFLLPSFLLATTQPLIIKSALKDQAHLGRGYGQIAASSSIGSLLGVFLTGFYLISTIGSKNLIQIIFLLILALSIVIFIKEKRKELLAVAIVLGLLFFFASNPQSDKSERLLSKTESNYYKIRVVERDFMNYGKSRMMMIDLDLHSIESEKKLNIYTDIYPLFKNLKTDLSDVLVIGGGAYTLPKNIQSYYPNSNVEVIELDPEVTKLAEEYFSLDAGKIKTLWGDARTIINNSEKKYDLIYGDAYNSIISVPGHLLTKEYNDAVRGQLKDGGIYTLNFIASKANNKKMLSAVYHTFQKTFPEHFLISFAADDRDVQNFNLVGINSKEKISYESLIKKMGDDPAARGLIPLIVPVPELAVGPEKIILTDNYFPVESLMSSVIKSEYKKLRDFNRALYY
jgi:spermidine synthase